MKPDPAIICCGMVVADVLVQGMEALPRSGETAFAQGIVMATGGDAVNQAMALAKLGNSVGLMGLVGADGQGSFIKSQCEAAGIATSGLYVDPALHTATGIVLVSAEGERSFITFHGATHHAYGPAHIDLALIRRGLKALSIGSLFCSARFDREALVPLLQRAKAVGAITLVDMVMDQRGYGLNELAEIWPLLDYAAPSLLEAEILTGSTDPARIAKTFQKLGVKNVILKQGEGGVTAFIGDKVFTCPIFKVPVLDTTGAGDTFMGGFIHCLAQGLAPEEALRFGSAAAALSISAVGAGAGLKSLSQVEHFLKQQDAK